MPLHSDCTAPSAKPKLEYAQKGCTSHGANASVGHALPLLWQTCNNFSLVIFQCRASLWCTSQMPHYGIPLPVLSSLPFPSLPFPSLPFPSLSIPMPYFPLPSLTQSESCLGAAFKHDMCLVAVLSCNISAVTVVKGLTHSIVVAEQKTPQQDRTSNGAAPEGLASTIQHMTQWPQTLIVGSSCAPSGQLHWVTSWHCHASSGMQLLMCTCLCRPCVGVVHTSQLTWLGHLLVIVSSI